jgi:hypothetical protein
MNSSDVARKGSFVSHRQSVDERQNIDYSKEADELGNYWFLH